MLIKDPSIIDIEPIITIDFLSVSETIMIIGIAKHNATIEPSSHQIIPGKSMNEITIDTKKYCIKAETFARFGNFFKNHWYNINNAKNYPNNSSNYVSFHP